MIYGTDAAGNVTLTLTLQESKAFKQGIPIVKTGAYARGSFRIEVKLSETPKEDMSAEERKAWGID